MPPQAIAWKLQDTQWCLQQAEASARPAMMSSENSSEIQFWIISGQPRVLSDWPKIWTHPARKRLSPGNAF